jgi:hypothetical protein
VDGAVFVVVVVVVVVLVTVVVGPVSVRVGVVTETPIDEDVDLLVATVFSSVVVSVLLLPLFSAYARPPPTSRAITTASATNHPPKPRFGLRSAPQLGQYAAPSSTG